VESGLEKAASGGHAGRPMWEVEMEEDARDVAAGVPVGRGSSERSGRAKGWDG
jgi:hypothetical protein